MKDKFHNLEAAAAAELVVAVAETAAAFSVDVETVVGLDVNVVIAESIVPAVAVLVG